MPITSKGKLVGILTNRDLRFETRLDLKISDLMTKENLITVPVGTTLEKAMAILHRHRVEKLPVVDDKYRLKGLITVKDIQKKIAYPNACKDDLGRLRVGAAIGATGDYPERAAALIKAGVDVLFIDTAHGHSTRVVERNQEREAELPGCRCDRRQRRDRGGSGGSDPCRGGRVKVGMGPGSICTTRVVTGAGVPQITAILDCARRSRNAPGPRSSPTAASSIPATSRRPWPPVPMRSWSDRCSRAPTRAPERRSCTRIAATRCTAAWVRSRP